MGTLYHIVEQGKEEEIEVRQHIKEGAWDREKLSEILEEDLVDHIIESISPMLKNEADVPWWIPQPDGLFTTKTAFPCLRKKKEEISWMQNIWIKGVPLKICFFCSEESRKEGLLLRIILKECKSI